MAAGGTPAAQIVKFGLKGQALAMAAELHPHNVAVVAITPGFLRSETMLQRFGVTEDTWRKGGTKDKNFLASESPLFVGRAVAALAQDREIMKRTGQLLSSWELAREYRFTDADGTRPDWGKTKLDFSGHPSWLVDYIRTSSALSLDWLERVTTRTKSLMKQWPKEANRGNTRPRKARPRPGSRPGRKP